MKAPWYVDVHRQANVLNKIADRLITEPEGAKKLNRVQERMWSKFDVYMLRRSAEM